MLYEHNVQSMFSNITDTENTHPNRMERAVSLSPRHQCQCQCQCQHQQPAPSSRIHTQFKICIFSDFEMAEPEERKPMGHNKAHSSINAKAARLCPLSFLLRSLSFPNKLCKLPKIVFRVVYFQLIVFVARTLCMRKLTKEFLAGAPTPVPFPFRSSHSNRWMDEHGNVCLCRLGPYAVRNHARQADGMESLLAGLSCSVRPGCPCRHSIFTSKMGYVNKMMLLAWILTSTRLIITNTDRPCAFGTGRGSSGTAGTAGTGCVHSYCIIIFKPRQHWFSLLCDA